MYGLPPGTTIAVAATTAPTQTSSTAVVTNGSTVAGTAVTAAQFSVFPSAATYMYSPFSFPYGAAMSAYSPQAAAAYPHAIAVKQETAVSPEKSAESSKAALASAISVASHYPAGVYPVSVAIDQNSNNIAQFDPKAHYAMAIAQEKAAGGSHPGSPARSTPSEH